MVRLHDAGFRCHYARQSHNQAGGRCHQRVCRRNESQGLGKHESKSKSNLSSLANPLHQLLFGGIAIFVIFANIMIGWGRSKTQPAPVHPPAYSHVPVMGPDVTPAHFRQRFESPGTHFNTPRSQRYAYIEDDTDFDMSTPKALGQGFGYMPAGHRSPGKGEWSASSNKYHRSPSRGY